LFGDAGRDRIEGFLGAGTQQDDRAQVRQLFGDSSANAASSAGYEGLAVMGSAPVMFEPPIISNVASNELRRAGATLLAYLSVQTYNPLTGKGLCSVPAEGCPVPIRIRGRTALRPSTS
jgi:hypothetical protein